MVRRPPKPTDKQLDALHRVMREVLDREVQQKELEGHFDSPYGLIYYRVYDYWVAFQLRDFNRDSISSRWYGWDHWKQNYHYIGPWGKAYHPTVEAELTQHIRRFFRPLTAAGFPSVEELQATARAREERNDQWERWRRELSSSGYRSMQPLESVEEAR